MTLRSSLLTVLAVSTLPLALSAQVAPAPAAATPAASPAAKKAASLSSGDKQLVKTTAETQLLLLHLSEIVQGQPAPGSAAVQALAASTRKAMNDAWGDLGTVAMARATEMPKTEQTAGEKKELGEMRKLPGDKFDKAYLKAFTKESKHAATIFAGGAKSASDADLKAFYAKYQPIVTKIDADATAASGEGKKK